MADHTLVPIVKVLVGIRRDGSQGIAPGCPERSLPEVPHLSARLYGVKRSHNVASGALRCAGRSSQIPTYFLYLPNEVWSCSLCQCVLDSRLTRALHSTAVMDSSWI